MITNDLLKKKVLHYFFESVIQKYETKLEKTKDNFEIQTGKKDANFGDSSGEYPFYTCALVPIKSKTYSYDGEYLILPGNGANVGATIYFKGKFEAYQRTYLISSKTGMVDMKYAYYYYLAYWQEYNQNKMYGSAIPYIRLGNLENFEILYPKDISVQKEVATQIDNMFKLIETKEKNDQEKAKLKEVLKEKILDSAIRGNLVENDISLKAIDYSNSISNIPFAIPNNWRWTTIQEISYSVYDGSHNPPKDSGIGIPILSALNIHDNKININEANRFVTLEDYSKENKKIDYQQGDVLLTIVGTVGRTAIIDFDDKFCLQRSVSIIKPKEFIYSKYLMYFLESKYCLDIYKEEAKGTAQAGFYLKKLKELNVSVPPLEEQKRIVEKIESLFELIEQL